MPNESSPPIHDLPDEIETALSAYATVCFLRGVYGEVREGRLEETECNLRNAIFKALDDARQEGPTDAESERPAGRD